MTLTNPVTPAQWRGPYFVAAALALIILSRRLMAGEMLHRIHFSIALYFISGAIALVIGWTWLNQWYGRLEGSAMLWWIFVVGTGFSLFSKAGFAGIEGVTPLCSRKVSCLLIAVALSAAILSTYAIGNRLLSIYLPFVALFIAYSVAQTQLEQKRGDKK